jgi:hypothetical protein
MLGLFCGEMGGLHGGVCTVYLGLGCLWDITGFRSNIRDSDLDISWDR